jgi:hypothetical protein
MLLGLQMAFEYAVEGYKVSLETCLQVGLSDESKLKPVEVCADGLVRDGGKDWQVDNEGR